MESFIENNNRYVLRLNDSLSKINDISLIKKRLTYIRWKVAENLDKLLFEFETNVKKTDANVHWCPDVTSTIENLNKQLKSYTKINFFKHNAVKHLVRELDMKVPDCSDNPEVVVIGAKFILANTGNFYSVFNNFQEYEQMLNAKKIIVIAGIDSVLALQSELYLSKQLYSIFETGNLHYQTEILCRPGRIRGIGAEITILLTDLHKNKLLDLPMHRPLFSLLNFDLPAVCPQDSLKPPIDSWFELNTLERFLNSFMDGLSKNINSINGNYGFNILNQYLPYDIDLNDQVLNARSILHETDKVSILNKIIDTDKSALALNPKKFNDKEKFHKYAERNFFGQFN
jgi:hypothetical protein